jgi:replicative DNA helicase
MTSRIIGGFLSVETWKLKKGELTPQDFERMGPLFDQLRDHPIYIDDDPDTTLSNLRSKARRQQIECGLDLLIVDYLQLIEVPDRRDGENRTQQVSYISRTLKQLARELGCPVIALSQLSRSVEQRNPPIPILSDLRESGSIEQDADSVVMLYREGYYNEDCEDPSLTDVYVRKNRNGPTGRVLLQFVKERMVFRMQESRMVHPR